MDAFEDSHTATAACPLAGPLLPGPPLQAGGAVNLSVPVTFSRSRALAEAATQPTTVQLPTFPAAQTAAMPRHSGAKATTYSLTWLLQRLEG